VSEIIGLALFPRPSGWEQLQRNFSGIIDFQRYVPSLADLREEFESGRINMGRTRIVLVADNMAQGVSTALDSEGGVVATHLVQAIGNFLSPRIAGVDPVPVFILRTTGNEADALIEDVRDYLAYTRDQETARLAMERFLTVMPASITAIHQRAKMVLEDYPQDREPTNFLVLDNIRSAGVGLTGAPLITCTSAKGGVGKTTTALLLGFAASYIAYKQGRRLNVAIVELDLGSAQIGHIVGSQPTCPTILDYVNMSIPTEKVLLENLVEVDVRNKSGVDILPPGSLRVLHSPHDGGDDKNIRAHHVREIIALLKNSPDVDLVIVDTAPELREDDRIRAALEESNLILYITQDSRASFGIMTQNLEHLKSDYNINPERMKIVINNSVRTIDDQTLLADVRSMADGISPLAVIPRSNAVHEASGATGEDGQLFHALFDPSDPDVAFAYQSLVAAVSNYVESEAGTPDAAPIKEEEKKAKRGLFGKG
jgi:MinD-like ATPase involved in chromosome partitioning or flagellar assembly